MLVTSSTAVPLLVNVTDCTAEVVPPSRVPKVSVVLPRATLGMVPVPLRTTVCGLSVVLSPIVMEAARVPAALGVKVTWIAHALRRRPKYRRCWSERSLRCSLLQLQCS